MRRAIVAAVMGTLVLGGATATPAFAARHGAVKAKTVTARTIKSETDKPKTDKPKTAALKTVVYHGYVFKVPASWPVYDLSQHPSTCVRYDRHAVYLGTPGLNMQCPAALMGRTETVSIIPSVTIAAGSGSEITYQRQQPDSTGNTRVRSLPAVRATLTGNTAARELRVALGAAALTATAVATYGRDPAVVEQVFASLRVAPKKASSAWARSPAAALRAAEAATAVSESAAIPARAAKHSRKGWSGLPPGWPVQIIRSPPKKPTPAVHPVSGIDACTAPSLGAMRAWRHDYRAIGFYIGGENTGCAGGNVSASWFESIAGMGWGAMPTYVGPQASCTSAVNVWEINASHAVAEGRRWGHDAVKDAKKFGLGRGSPIYYDMESYDAAKDPGCRTAVLRFLGSWDRTVSKQGYETAVYSSQGSGIIDMQVAAVSRMAGFTAPDAIWFADWNGKRSLNDGALVWPLAYRAKQYHGPVWRTIGGYRQDVDLDVVGGPLAR